MCGRRLAATSAVALLGRAATAREGREGGWEEGANGLLLGRDAAATAREGREEEGANGLLDVRDTARWQL